jgi:hypothetical protein
MMPLYSDNSDNDVQSEKALRAVKRELDLAFKKVDHEGNRNRVDASKEAKKKAKLLKKQQRRQAS